MDDITSAPGPRPPLPPDSPRPQPPPALDTTLPPRPPSPSASFASTESAPQQPGSPTTSIPSSPKQRRRPLSVLSIDTSVTSPRTPPLPASPPLPSDASPDSSPTGSSASEASSSFDPPWFEASPLSPVPVHSGTISSPLSPSRAYSTTSGVGLGLGLASGAARGHLHQGWFATASPASPIAVAGVMTSPVDAWRAEEETWFSTATPYSPVNITSPRLANPDHPPWFTTATPLSPVTIPGTVEPVHDEDEWSGDPAKGHRLGPASASVGSDAGKAAESDTWFATASRTAPVHVQIPSSPTQHAYNTYLLLIHEMNRRAPWFNIRGSRYNDVGNGGCRFRGAIAEAGGHVAVRHRPVGASAGRKTIGDQIFVPGGAASPPRSG
ncbi:hypothetical protein BDK51DRAFT_50906 [Blyttiomyces helicus]|uniref:Uncharacterized protein n=1 Tax=Blyttiomyces helicus TaxID=388810 RepID=A0A4P9VYY5_9FUNG|nr:hypothetical protein BDK51DRAFT_50906 [Blyttiomyces helicus]|eukprot:RKO83548.1 hypothetical protein BDK51DRAFT_50906 [Blyttiomyces helicus]